MLKPLENITGQTTVTNSPIEEILYEKLLQFELQAIPQYNVLSFFIDLAFPEIKLAIEADGAEYHTSRKQKKHDAYRENLLKEQGWTVERFTGSFIHRNGDVASAKIALKYFDKNLTPQQRQKALGILVVYFTVNNPELALRLTELALSLQKEKLKY